MTAPQYPPKPLAEMTPAEVVALIRALAAAIEASGDPWLQRAASDALREAADRLRI